MTSCTIVIPHDARITKWPVELGALQINFTPHNTIKAEVLAEFMAGWTKIQQPMVMSKPIYWTMYFDRSLKCGGPAIRTSHFPVSEAVRDQWHTIVGDGPYSQLRSFALELWCWNQSEVPPQLEMATGTQFSVENSLIRGRVWE
jgi:hypothetical protein